ncbi:MAG: 4Fe-4S dicluster domain-containing protein [Desulfobulbaceae bacterium]|nr:MAG: 4Fe-4S dicluster domain-containing protein [Desulfobulbaceae bacterium]
MEINKVKLIYFSPTGTTRKVLENVAKGIAGTLVEHIDLTLPCHTRQAITPSPQELVILGAPVYGGRLPVDAINRFRRVRAGKTLAVVVVVYGNREFDDALLELRDLAVELGFLPVAGGAFIGEHSFASPDAPIANGRPDSVDLQKATAFGARIGERVASLQSPVTLTALEIPGKFPYEGGPRNMAVSPITKKDICTLCGTCASVCPTAAISVNDSVATAVKACIRCCACIKSCPTGARRWEDDTMKIITAWLTENCRTRKEPQLFGVEA